MSAFIWLAAHPVIAALILAWMIGCYPLAVLVGRTLRAADDEMVRRERFVKAMSR